MTKEQIIAQYEFQIANDPTLSDVSIATMKTVIEFLKGE